MMRNIAPVGSLFFILMIATVGQAQTPPAGDQANKANRSKVLQLLEDTGHNYSKSSDDVWVVPYTGNNLKEFNVVTVLEQNLVVLVVILAEKDGVKYTPEMMTRVLRLNEEFDRVKIGVSESGNLFVRIDLSLRILDGQELKENIEQIAAAADEAYLAIKPYLTSQKK
ncbi:MAG: YbjN domain-containing protein [Acidobacteriota bacterium]|nr:MAG: YbjN domain-containing protein [Acidobacteriota bacterium]